MKGKKERKRERERERDKGGVKVRTIVTFLGQNQDVSFLTVVLLS